MPRPLFMTTLLLAAGCPPWIPPADHAGGAGPGELLAERSPLAECEGEAGGTAWFVGDWTLGGEVRGDEHYLVLANQAWLDEGGADCWHTFTVDGPVEGDPVDDGALVDAAFRYQPDRSTCARDDLYVATDWIDTLTVDADGRRGDAARVSLPGGALYAEGTLDGQVLTYETGPFCVTRQGTGQGDAGDSASGEGGDTPR